MSKRAEIRRAAVPFAPSRLVERLGSLRLANRRIQALTEENEQARKDLADARAKLDAIANLERNMSDRRPAPSGAKP